MKQNTIIIISGPPCTGKTTLGKKIAKKFCLPMISRDAIKESLFDSLGGKDRQWSKKLGIASYKLLYLIFDSFLQARKSVVLDSNFKAEFDEEEIDKLNGQNIFAVSENYIVTKLKEKDINVEVERIKSEMKSFIIYQLTNAEVNHGVGCGLYNMKGKGNEKIIKNAMNQYLFDICFDIKRIDIGMKNFLDYLLINLSHSWGHSKSEYTPRIENYSQVLDKDMLMKYWTKNRISLIEYSKKNKIRIIYTRGYTVNYQDHLDGIFDVLNDLLPNSKSQVA